MWDEKADFTMKLAQIEEHANLAHAEPGARGGRVGQAPARHRRPGPDLDRMPAEPLDHAEAVLVGEVVAEEHRHPAGEGLFLHERLDRAALVVPDGLELGHHLAALHLDAVAHRARGFTYHGMRRAREVRGEAVMQRHAVALV